MYLRLKRIYLCEKANKFKARVILINQSSICYDIDAFFAKYLFLNIFRKLFCEKYSTINNKENIRLIKFLRIQLTISLHRFELIIQW